MNTSNTNRPLSNRVRPSSSKVTPNLGKLGEQLVSAWLQQQGWIVLHQRWRCYWGELDIIAQFPEGLAFVEVKTRTLGSWDVNGLLAVDAKKQAKLWHAAELFLAENPQLANCASRFDVALVTCLRQPSPRLQASLDSLEFPLFQPGEPIEVGGYRLVLAEYLSHAFEE